jgi:hypothetical protein
MIDRYPNKVAITSSSTITTHGQLRRLPHQGARHGTIYHGDASDCVFLLFHLWVLPSSWAILLLNDLPPLSLACGWPLSVNDSLACEWRRLHELRVEGSSGARKGGLNSRGSSCIYALCPLHLHYFDDVILASKMEVLLTWSPVFYDSILGDVPL